jgi:hypothetical protein
MQWQIFFTDVVGRTLFADVIKQWSGNIAEDVGAG